MDRKTQMEMKNLQKIGLTEDLAMLCAGVKTGNNDVVDMVITELNDEQQGLKEALEFFKPYASLAITSEASEESKQIKKVDESVFVEVNPITNEKKEYRLPHDKRAN